MLYGYNYLTQTTLNVLLTVGFLAVFQSVSQSLLTHFEASDLSSRQSCDIQQLFHSSQLFFFAAFMWVLCSRAPGDLRLLCAMGPYIML